MDIGLTSGMVGGRSGGRSGGKVVVIPEVT